MKYNYIYMDVYRVLCDVAYKMYMQYTDNDSHLHTPGIDRGRVIRGNTMESKSQC
ncbi:hypothetical protein [Porphyromonas pogonae]|uniref:hypothetical protein n=1 Tax=Porphyromonas pogonae TaxID=867595 RepID=UPI002E7876CF|nr:hypothetical protein [Porphyromonas pogonae]